MTFLSNLLGFKERDPSEGPVPRLDTCLCLLLSITPLAIVNIIEEEENFLMDDIEHCSADLKKCKKVSGELRNDLVSSVQQLGDYEGLLTPPGSVSSVANQAATKAMMFLSGISVGSGYLDGITLCDKPVNCGEFLKCCNRRSWYVKCAEILLFKNVC